MRSAKIGVGCVLSAMAMMAMGVSAGGCESSSSSSGGLAAGDSGVFDPDSGGNAVDPPVASECVAPTGGPTMHGGGSSSDSDETWTAAGSPHILPFDVTIYKTVTIEPCAEVLIASGAQVTVRGKLIAEGSATKRIHIGAKVAGQAWANIRTLSPATMSFAYATLDGGGAVGNTHDYLTGVLNVAGDELMPVQETIKVDHVTIAGSLSSGIVLTENASFAATSNALVVKGSVSHPISIWGRAVGSVPVGSYTGNTIDKILLPTTSNNSLVDNTTTIHERGVPYLVGHDGSDGAMSVDVQAGHAPITLTIEPGVQMQFKKGGSLRVGIFSVSGTTTALASLVAVGTADKKILFTSAETTPAAGDWLGLGFGDVPTGTNKVTFATVAFAGGTSVTGSDSCILPGDTINDAAIRFSGPPPAQFVTNTTISDSLTNAFDRGYRSDEKIDFQPTNMFLRVGKCLQTYPKDANGACPDPSMIPCPK